MSTAHLLRESGGGVSLMWSGRSVDVSELGAAPIRGITYGAGFPSGISVAFVTPLACSREYG